MVIDKKLEELFRTEYRKRMENIKSDPTGNTGGAKY
jgi:hypothetical protein